MLDPCLCSGQKEKPQASPEVPRANRFQALVWEKGEARDSGLELERGDGTKKVHPRTRITTSAANKR